MIRMFLLVLLCTVTSQVSLADPSFDEVMAKAKAGNAIAQYNLGVMYANGEGVSRDYKQATNWYTKAAEQGYARAQFNLGLQYEEGQGVKQDYEEAVSWYTKAAERDYTDAQYNLGLMYAHGKGVKQDYRQAYAWFSIAAIDGAKDVTSNRDIAAARLTAEELNEARRLAADLVRKIEKQKAATKSPQ